MALHKVRAVALTGFEEVARSVGLDPIQMLERHGIHPALLENPEQRLPATSVAALIQDSAEESGDEAFALLLADRRTFESLGPVTELYRPLGSFRAIVEATVQGRRLVSDVFELRIDDSGPDPFLTVGVLPQFASIQAIILTVAMTHLVLKGASRGRWKPRAVHFRHPPPAEQSEFASFFAAPVKFGQRSDGFDCEKSDFEDGWQPESELNSAGEIISSLERQIAALKEISGSGEDDLILSLEETIVEIRLATEQLRG